MFGQSVYKLIRYKGLSKFPWLSDAITDKFKMIKKNSFKFFYISQTNFVPTSAPTGTLEMILLKQFFLRLCAVFGGVYYLGRNMSGIIVKVNGTLYSIYLVLNRIRL